jgi:hypothetical protein
MNQPTIETPAPAKSRWWKVDRTTIHAAYILTCFWFAAAAAVYQAVHVFSEVLPIGWTTFMPS